MREPPESGSAREEQIPLFYVALRNRGAPRNDCPRCHNDADSTEHVLFEYPHVAPEARDSFYNQMAIAVAAFTRLDLATRLEFIMDPKTPKELDGLIYSFIREVGNQLRP